MPPGTDAASLIFDCSGVALRNEKGRVQCALEHLDLEQAYVMHVLEGADGADVLGVGDGLVVQLAIAAGALVLVGRAPRVGAAGVLALLPRPPRETFLVR